MLGTIAILLVIGAVLYVLWASNVFNADSMNDSSDQSNTSVQPGQGARGATSYFSRSKIKNVRIAHGESDVNKVSVLESPARYDQITTYGNNVGPNTIFLGLLESALNGVDVENRSTENFVIKKFKNMFIVFKGLDYTEIDNNNLMVRYEANKMVFALIDASNSTLPELLRDVSYPICVLINNPSAQLVLKEWGYTQVNDSATLFVRNEKSFRLQ